MSKPYGVRARVRSLTLDLKKRLSGQRQRVDGERHSQGAAASAGQSRTREDRNDPVSELSLAGGAQ
jgi:hypothetical protein